MGHLHEIVDSDKYFVIDPITRVITTESTKLTLIQYDHNSERYTFEMPRNVEGHDMSTCNQIQIHFDNVSKNKKETNHDLYTVTDMRVSEDDESSIIFSWLISRSATQIIGKLSFSVHFACVSDQGTIDYSWHTASFDKVVINGCIHNTNSVVEEHSDFVSMIESIVNDIKTNYQIKPKLTTIDLRTDRWNGSGMVYYQTITVPNVTENSQVDLRPSPEQLQELLINEISLTAANEEGLVTVFAIGGMPTSDYSMQIIISEVVAA